jgi:alkylation response protein AidB-like acyl-CoA dehydrogenase
MNFEMNEEHYAFRDAVSRYLSAHAGGGELRRYWTENRSDRSLWSGLAELGVPGLSIATDDGGVGLEVWEASLLIEAFGRFAVPHPIAETIGAVVPILARYGSADLRSEWLPGIAEGRVMASVQDGWDGLAGWGRDADLVLVARDDGVSLCRPSDRTFAPAHPPDPARRPARLSPQDAFAVLPGKAAAEALRARSRTVFGQVLIGLGDAVIEQAVAYAKMREQFGRPIGSFQAVKHLLANAHVALETARRAGWFAMWCLDHDDPRGNEFAAIAKGGAAEAALEASYAALQVHGAIGYTWDCDLHLWLKRIHVLEGLFGGAATQWDVLAKHYFQSPGANI